MSRRHRHHQNHHAHPFTRHLIASPRPGVAPSAVIRQDFDTLARSTLLRTSSEVEQLILMQSIEGHAHEGHGAFRGRRFPNLTMEDTVRALGLPPSQVAGARQQLIDEIATWVHHALDGKAPNRLVDEQGYPLLDVSSLRPWEVDPRAVLKGLCIGGLRDNSEVRLPVEKQYGVKIGGGACYLVDVRVMERMGLDGEQLAHGEYAGQLEHFEDEGLITGYDRPGFDPEHARYLYIRHRKGGGTSDDAALVACGLLWGLGAALGAFLADAVDTLEKYVPHYFDQDDDLAMVVREAMPDLVSEEEIGLVTYLCSIPEEGPPVPDCSLRHMLMVNREVDQTPLEGHLLFVQGLPYAPMEIGFEQLSNTEFYSWISDRVNKHRP